MRFCTIPYAEPSKANIHQAYMHLTNYSLNKYRHVNFLFACITFRVVGWMRWSPLKKRFMVSHFSSKDFVHHQQDGDEPERAGSVGTKHMDLERKMADAQVGEVHADKKGVGDMVQASKRSLTEVCSLRWPVCFALFSLFL